VKSASARRAAREGGGTEGAGAAAGNSGVSGAEASASSVSVAGVVAPGESDTRSTGASDGGAAALVAAGAAEVTVMFSLMAENEYDWKPLIVTNAPRVETGSREPQT